MRASSRFGRVIAFATVSSAALFASTIVLPAAEPGPDINAVCRIPFEKLKDSKTGEPFPVDAAINASTKISEKLRLRYVVADLNSSDPEGNCRGVQEYFTPVEALSDFPRLSAIAASRKVELVLLAKEGIDSLRATESAIATEEAPADPAALAVELDDLNNYLQQVHRFRTDPVVKPPVFNNYCVGQTLSFCELVDGQPKLVYRFVTSSSRATPPLYRYYAPVNIINTRNWSGDRIYGAADARRDVRMGGGDARIIPFHNGGNPIPMPNFMHFLPAPGYTGETGNGIHEIAGGLDSGGTFGSPVSLGCIRLNKYQAKLARWWIPREAKFFIYFEPNQYRHYGDVATGKARGFQIAGSTPAQNATPIQSYAAEPARRSSTVDWDTPGNATIVWPFPFFANTVR